jgi:hypothetical protein
MSLNVSDKSGQGFEPIPEGTHTAVCYGVIDLGKQFNEKFGKSTDKVLIMWELPDEIEDGQELPRVFSQRYTASLNSKSKLRKDLAAWRGRDFTDAELDAFNLRNILGTACLIQIIHKENNGKTFANLASIMALPKGMPRPLPKHEIISFDLDEDDLSALAKLPDWIVDVIKESETFKQRLNEERGYGSNKPVDVSAADFEEADDDLPL